jgi:hypothetical protein
VDEHRRCVGGVRGPVAPADLVADQRIARGIVRDAQQRLRQAHQRNSLLAREGELLDQRLDSAPTAFRAERLDQAAGKRMRGSGGSRRESRRFDQTRHAGRFIHAIHRRYLRSQFRLWRQVRAERSERLR